MILERLKSSVLRAVKRVAVVEWPAVHCRYNAGVTTRIFENVQRHNDSVLRDKFHAFVLDCMTEGMEWTEQSKLQDTRRLVWVAAGFAPT